ncbi:MAG: PKD domain-containing protein [Nitrososphaerota archaeon]|nr:PKD domain-containing protein [Nitrososphaerota archaeon]
MAREGRSWAKVALVVVLVTVMAVPNMTPDRDLGGRQISYQKELGPSIEGNPDDSSHLLNGKCTALSCHLVGGASSTGSVANISVGIMPEGLVYDSRNGNIYVANYNCPLPTSCGQSTISVISTSTNVVVATVPVGNGSLGLAYDNNKGEIFVTNSGSNNVSVVNDTTNTVIRTISFPTSKCMPDGIAYDPAGGEVIVVQTGCNEVSIISDTTDAVVANVSVGIYPRGVVYDSGKGEFFVANRESDTVSVINGTTDKVVGTILVGSNPNSLGYDSRKGEIFVSLVGSGTVSVISDTNNSVVATIQASWPEGIDYDSGSRTVFVVNRNSNDVEVINDTTDNVVADLGVETSPYGVVYDAVTDEIFVTNSICISGPPCALGSVSVISLRLLLSAYSTTGSGPAWLNVSFSASAFGGSWNYTSWAWTFGDGNTSALQNPSHTYRKPGSYQANVTVTDSAGNKTSQTIWINVTHPLPFNTTLTPTNNSVKVGQPVWVNASMTGGVAPFTFKWNATPSYAGCIVSSASSVATCTPTRPGVAFSLGVEVTDLYGATDNATSSNITVNSFAATLSASKTSVVVGQSVTFNVTTSGDSATLSYAYTYLPAAGCGSPTGPSITCTPQKPGWNFTINVTVKDQYGNTWNATSPTVSTRSLSAVLITSQVRADVNESLILSTQTTGDAAPLTYSYNSPSWAGCAPSIIAILNCTPNATGNFSVTVKITDSYGNTWNATSLSIQVYPALKVNLTVSSSTPLLAQTVAFIANASGGRAPYNYTYLGLPYGCYSENKSTIGCLPTQSDWYNITVVVKDMNNGTARAIVTMHVIFDFNVVIPASTPVGKQLTIMVNTNETFNGSAINKTALFSPAGGYGTFTYSYAGLPPGCTSKDVSVLTCTPTQAGKFSVVVSVRDQAGDHQTHTVLVNIVPASGLAGVLSSLWESPYAVASIVAIAVIVGVVLLLRRKRSKREPLATTEDKESREGPDDDSTSSKEPGDIEGGGRL